MLYTDARERNLRGWSRTTRGSRINVVTLNPEHDAGVNASDVLTTIEREQRLADRMGVLSWHL